MRPQSGKPAWKPRDTVYSLSRISDRRSGQGIPTVLSVLDYILDLTHLLGTHEVPVAQWPRELSPKLKNSAANWYAAQFPGGHFPSVE